MDREPLASLADVIETIERARENLAALSLPINETFRDLNDALAVARLNAVYLSAEIHAEMQTPADRKAVRA